MTGFKSPIVGGQNSLLIPAIQSPNYVHGETGWAIFKDGSAEFHDISIPEGSGGTVVTFSPTAPTSPSTGDVWYDTDAGLEASVWNGSGWVAYQIGAGAIAPGAVGMAQLADSVTARALGGITTTVSGTEPYNPVTGDLWINSSQGNSIWQYNGTSWTQYQWGANALAAGSVNQYAIQSGAVGTSNIAAGAVTATQIAAATIIGSLIAASTITGGNIAAGTIEASNIAANTITGTNIAADTITATNLGPAAVNAVNVAANMFGLNMIADPTFSSSALNALRAASPTSGTWTLGSGTAEVTQSNHTAVLYLTPPSGLWLNPGEQYYLSVEVTASAATGVACGIGIENTAMSSSVNQTNDFAAAGTVAVSGVVTIPSGFGASGFIRLTVTGSSTDAATVTFANPVCQPAQLTGDNWVLNQNGLFIYAAAPASGNLVVSITPTAGTDSFGNAYRANITVYDTSGTDYIQIEATHPAQLNIGTGDTDEASPGYVVAGVVGSGTTRELATQLVAPKVTGEASGASAAISLTSQAVSLSGSPVASMQATDGTNTSAVDVSPTAVTIAGLTNTVTGPLTMDAIPWTAIPMASGWSAISGSPVPSYRKLPWGDIQLCGAASFSSSFTAGTTFAAAGAVPSPATTQRVAGAWTNAGVQVNTNGALVAEPPSGGATNCIFNGIYPTNL